MSQGQVTLFVDKNNGDSISFLSAATGYSDVLNVFRPVLPSQRFQLNSISRGGKQLHKYSSVIFSLANSHSFRVVTVSGYRPDSRRLIELWDARSGSLMWEKEAEGWEYRILPEPRFSEDGRYLVIYDGNWIEIVNANTAQTAGVITAKDYRVGALAVANDGTSVAVSR